MSRPCTPCIDPRREEINAALISNEPIRKIAARLAISPSALQRHKTAHLPAALVKAVAAAEEVEAGTLLQRLTSLHRALHEKDQAPFLVRVESQAGNHTESKLESRQKLIDHLMELGKKDLQIQRYKGLGEMNPEQLWETTMDLEKRTLLQVRINDKVFTDDIFTILMGDAVEPRRQFIEENALEVKNLDI